MFVNRETDYAIRIVRNLNENELSQIENISSKENISITMAHKVARILKNSGVISSKSGINGGYYLNRPLSEITLFDVYGAMNGTADINACIADKELCPFAQTSSCKVHSELCRIQAILHEELKRKPISELI